MDPGFGSRPTALEVTAGAHSLRPYPSQMSIPNRSRKPVRTLAGSGAAPDTAKRTEERSGMRSFASARASHAENMGGAPNNAVTRCSATSSNASLGSKRSTRTAVAPVFTASPRIAFNA